MPVAWTPGPGSSVRGIHTFLPWPLCASPCGLSLCEAPGGQGYALVTWAELTAG